MRCRLAEVTSILQILLLPAVQADTSCPVGADNCEDPDGSISDAFSALQPHRPRLVTNDVAPGGIPKIVHHIYKNDISSGPWPNPMWKQSFMAWKTLFPEPEFKHIFWSDAKMVPFVKSRCSKYYKAFTHEQRAIVRSDFSRYCILWRLGGIYADLDYEPLSQFYDDLVPGKVNLVQSPYVSETYQNSLMASPPKHIYWEKLMGLAQFTILSSNVLLAAGPQLLETLPATHDHNMVHALPCNAFQRATHTWDERERQASLRKKCKLLRLEDVNDASLKGIHWGTVSYHNVDTGKNAVVQMKMDGLDSFIAAEAADDDLQAGGTTALVAAAQAGLAQAAADSHGPDAVQALPPSGLTALFTAFESKLQDRLSPE